MKVKVGYTIEETLIPLIEKEAQEQERSASAIVDKILKLYFKSKEESAIKTPSPDSPPKRIK